MYSEVLGKKTKPGFIGWELVKFLKGTIHELLYRLTWRLGIGCMETGEIDESIRCQEEV